MKLLESAFMRISEAARRLGTSARMLRYREDLGLLPQVRDPFGRSSWSAGSRRPSSPGGPGWAADAGGPHGAALTPGGAASGGPHGAALTPGGAAPGRPHGAALTPGGSTPGGSALAGPHGPALGGLTPGGPAHRQFSEADLEAVAIALELERRYDISPASLAFGLRVLAEPAVRAAVADLGRRLGRIPATPGRALDFEKERALRLLSRG
jgi:hypothetical protein